ncbi:5-deoxy-glucuronate isomerase [Caloramator sp. CAR-1]|uniref:5-deoxy-glucuronate isomerase n=1 Tax=Caloramator sp. CAR-1 TaxID=3062777 RepID=UPI0026E3DF1D|nr:5-deoxy-glucuronate isomerase [Caloramator sp. CAR-1]MDO6355662.1 5-deoxy-glucuronate isomerase [Caloramator sp. CAR-1]
MLRIRHEGPFVYGYNMITSIDEKEDNTMMDFGILKIKKGQIEVDKDDKERVFLLIHGEVILEWQDRKETIKRKSCFDENPWVLHLPRRLEVKITGIAEDTEICLIKTINERDFEAKLYRDKECISEERGKGTMNETSTRIVRTVFDYSNAKYSNLVLGEVIDFPGKWSSYPPHFHPQPEIYFYKFYPENGYGFCQLGEEVYKVKNNDAVKILNNLSHPQTAAPGYAMYYIWVIRHLEDNPYITPIFEPEHLWVMDKDAKIWPNK